MGGQDDMIRHDFFYVHFGVAYVGCVTPYQQYCTSRRIPVVIYVRHPLNKKCDWTRREYVPYVVNNRLRHVFDTTASSRREGGVILFSRSLLQE